MRLSKVGRDTQAPNAQLDVVKALAYRPELFGAPYSQLLQTLLRGDSQWSIGERELFAGYTAHLNKCPF